jgi:hypothetical protein
MKVVYFLKKGQRNGRKDFNPSFLDKEAKKDRFLELAKNIC